MAKEYKMTYNTLTGDGFMDYKMVMDMYVPKADLRKLVEETRHLKKSGRDIEDRIRLRGRMDVVEKIDKLLED